MSRERYDDSFEWILYVRISDDREGGGLGVRRQEDDCRTLAEGLGGRILTVCSDNDLTANDRSGRYKPRPDYNRMCDLLRERRGERGVITWHADRLHRNPRELEDFIDLVEGTGAAVQTVKAGGIDLSTPSGRMIARQLCAVARYESEHKSDRIRRKVLELAADGKIANGGPRPFGYRRVFAGDGPRRKILRDEVDPTEAAIVAECARRTLAGHTLRSIVGDLNASAVPTSTGKLWTQQALRLMLRGGRIAGLREHNRVVVGKAVWPAIITKEQHQLLRALLDNKGRRGSRVRLHYLTGFVYCSECGTRGVKMSVVPQHGKLKYRCPPKQEGGCNGRIIAVAELVDLVDAYMAGRLSDPLALRQLAAREASNDGEASALLQRIEGDERRLALLTHELEDGDEEDLPEVLVTVRRLRARLREAKQSWAELTSKPELAGLDLPDLAARWPSLHLDQKQRLLRLFVARIEIKPARRGLPRFDPDRVDVLPA
ncbi:MAG TPA: recombinase family protein [Catenuloplanes sp.]|jgi:DNA invertase Pin-like site-specific DNA recombinase